jgi:hypothetical protein
MIGMDFCSFVLLLLTWEQKYHSGCSQSRPQDQSPIRSRQRGRPACQVDPTGKNLKGLGPFHQEKWTSFCVEGNGLMFMKRITGASFTETVRDLRRNVGIEVP